MDLNKLGLSDVDGCYLKQTNNDLTNKNRDITNQPTNQARGSNQL